MNCPKCKIAQAEILAMRSVLLEFVAKYPPTLTTALDAVYYSARTIVQQNAEPEGLATEQDNDDGRYELGCV